MILLNNELFCILNPNKVLVFSPTHRFWFSAWYSPCSRIRTIRVTAVCKMSVEMLPRLLQDQDVKISSKKLVRHNIRTCSRCLTNTSEDEQTLHPSIRKASHLALQHSSKAHGIKDSWPQRVNKSHRVQLGLKNRNMDLNHSLL